ncbi:uncharacterized protein V6R79_012700 [Siganus canaliculatus]
MLKGQSHPEWSLQAPPITRCPGPQQRSCLPLSMSPSQLLLCCLTLLPLACLQGSCLQCFGCNVGGGRGRGRGYVELGCSQPEVINCSQTERGFKLRSCLTTYSRSLDLVLSRGCATSRHCQQAELPGVSVECCDWSLCNGATGRGAGPVLTVIAACWFSVQGPSVP